MFLFPFVHPRYSYHLVSEEDSDAESGRDVCPGNTAFHIAASNGLRDIIEMFLVNERAGVTFPRCSGSLYNQQALKYLSLKPENRNCRLVDMVNDEPNTALHYMSVIPEGIEESRVVSTASLLLKYGASLFAKGRAGNTALAEAAQHGQLAMVKLFISKFNSCAQADGQPFGDEALAGYINTANSYDENAVILSARNHPTVLKVLLEHGGNPDSSRRGYNVIHIVCSRFNLDRQDPFALQHYHAEMSSPLSWGTPSPRISDDEEFKLPTRQSSRKQEKTLRYLIKYGANLRIAEPTTGMKPLHVASFWGDHVAIEMLINAGVDPNKELNMTNGWLPIHYACSEGQIFAVQTLIENGAIVWDSDNEIYQLPNIPEGAELPLPIPKYPFEIDTASLPLGLHVPSPLELMSFDALKRKVKKFSSKTDRK